LDPVEVLKALDNLKTAAYVGTAEAKFQDLMNKKYHSPKESPQAYVATFEKKVAELRETRVPMSTELVANCFYQSILGVHPQVLQFVGTYV